MRRFTTAVTSLALSGLVLATCTSPTQQASYMALSSVAQPSSSSSHPTYAGADLVADANEVVDEYCTRCHSERRQSGNLVLEDFDLAEGPTNGETVEKMIRKLRAGMMPPRSARRPDESVLEALATDLENTMDRAADRDPNPGIRTFQRLNRVEYRGAVKDLLGIDVDVSSFLPEDTKSANFDNIADVQMPSATVVEGYLRAASQISRIALGDADSEIASTIYRLPRIASQKDQAEGAPIGTRGGMAVEHNFPADGEYVFHIMPYAAVEGEVFGRTFGTEQVEVSIDGERVALHTIDRWMHESEPTGLNIRTDSIYVTAGPKVVSVAFVKQFEGVVDDLIRPIEHTMADGQIGIGYGVTSQQHLQRVTILGPYEVTGVSDTPTRRSIFSCRPTAPSEERACASEIVGRLATRAYRRPATDSEVDGIMAFYDQGSADGGFEIGIRTALQAILASPHFIFRIEERPSNVKDGEIYRISDIDLASRLSFFLWGLPPDQELLDLASRNKLGNEGELRRQISRMLDDSRSSGLASRFAAQWLRLQDLEDVHPDALSFPYFDKTLADAMHRETELLFEHLVHEDRPVGELLTADYSFVNERLARHYGIPGVTGSEFRQVDYPDATRRGLLGHGSVLTLTSHPDRTSPVLRGKWILEVLLGAPPPPPPPGVPDLEETEGADDGRFLTVRERMAQHRANPQCSSCHNVMDPIGLSLENFDPTGAWRTRDGGNAVDPSGELFDGTMIDGPAALREAILGRPAVYYRIFTENLMAYALGRRVEYFDMPTIRSIVRDAEKNEYRISSFVEGVVLSDAFQTARASAVVASEMENQ